MTVVPLPNFLCVGAGKSGTTSLQNILKQHPDIYLPRVKETTFFRDEGKYKRGIEFYQREYFSAWRGEKAIGEIDPSYLFYEKVPERLFRRLGDAVKLIFLLRNPVDRAYSHYLMSVRRGYEQEEFARALSLESARMESGGFGEEHFSYLAGGFYATQIKRYLRYFRKDRMLFILFETDFLQNRERTIASILNFIDVDRRPLKLNIKKNVARDPRSVFIRDALKARSFRRVARILIPITSLRDSFLTFLSELNMKPSSSSVLDSETRQGLIHRYFLHEIAELENIIGRDLSFWRAR